MVAVMVERRPLTVIEGSRAVVRSRMDDEIAAAVVAGWSTIRGWAAPFSRDRVVCVGWIRTADDARRALLAAVAGAGLVVGCSVDRGTVDCFLDDLRRLGPVDHVQDDRAPAPTGLTSSERALLGLIAEGLTTQEAAAELGLGRRTADRRLASACDQLGVASTSAAIAAVLSKRR